MPQQKRHGNEEYKRTSFALPQKLLKRLKIKSMVQGVPQNWIVEDAIRNELNDIDRYAKIEKLIEGFFSKIPELVSKSINEIIPEELKANLR